MEKKNIGRLAKEIARSGVASRRDAEALIKAGRIAVNGEVIRDVSTNINADDKITFDGKTLSKPPLRVFLYHKPKGYVTTSKDERGRETIFNQLPAALEQFRTIGRLDLNSEGLLLLTNDGDLKRALELPSTAWRRKYRVRAFGKVDEAGLDRLRAGISVGGEEFLPMEISVEREKGGNAWYSVSLREGKNREIRRAFEEIGLSVNRLIRISYGPFQLGSLAQGEVSELSAKALRTLLGRHMPEGAELANAPMDLTADLAAAAVAAARLLDEKAEDENGGFQKGKQRSSGQKRGEGRDFAPSSRARPARGAREAGEFDRKNPKRDSEPRAKKRSFHEKKPYQEQGEEQRERKPYRQRQGREQGDFSQKSRAPRKEGAGGFSSRSQNSRNDFSQSGSQSGSRSETRYDKDGENSRSNNTRNDKRNFDRKKPYSSSNRAGFDEGGAQGQSRAARPYSRSTGSRDDRAKGKPSHFSKTRENSDARPHSRASSSSEQRKPYNGKPRYEGQSRRDDKPRSAEGGSFRPRRSADSYDGDKRGGFSKSRSARPSQNTKDYKRSESGAKPQGSGCKPPFSQSSYKGDQGNKGRPKS